jgi:hypothetical protein
VANVRIRGPKGHENDSPGLEVGPRVYVIYRPFRRNITFDTYPEWEPEFRPRSLPPLQGGRPEAHKEHGGITRDAAAGMSREFGCKGGSHAGIGVS